MMACAIPQRSDENLTPTPASRPMVLVVTLVSLILLALGTYGVYILYHTAEQAPYMFRPTVQLKIAESVRRLKGEPFTDSLSRALIRYLESDAGLRVISEKNDVQTDDRTHKPDMRFMVSLSDSEQGLNMALSESNDEEVLWSGALNMSGSADLFAAINNGSGELRNLTILLSPSTQ